MKRTNVYITEKQLERLRRQAEEEGVAMAEVIRRAIDAFLAWNDTAYQPTPPNPPRSKDSHSSPG